MRRLRRSRSDGIAEESGHLIAPGGREAAEDTDQIRGEEFRLKRRMSFEDVPGHREVSRIKEDDLGEALLGHPLDTGDRRRPENPALAAAAVNLGLRHLAPREEVQLMRLDGTEGEPNELCALVGRDYGRIFDHEVVAMVIASNPDDRWHIPAASYQVKTLRGIMVWISEDRMVHGAREVKALTIRHTKFAPERFARGGADSPRLCRVLRPGGEAELTRATRTEIGHIDQEIMEWLRRREFSRRESERMIELAKVEEEGRPHSLAARERRHGPGAVDPARRHPGRLRVA